MFGSDLLQWEIMIERKSETEHNDSVFEFGDDPCCTEILRLALPHILLFFIMVALLLASYCHHVVKKRRRIEDCMAREGNSFPRLRLRARVGVLGPGRHCQKGHPTLSFSDSVNIVTALQKWNGKYGCLFLYIMATMTTIPINIFLENLKCKAYQSHLAVIVSL